MVAATSLPTLLNKFAEAFSSVADLLQQGQCFVGVVRSMIAERSGLHWVSISLCYNGAFAEPCRMLHIDLLPQMIA
jgi:hypothetical protein